MARKSRYAKPEEQEEIIIERVHVKSTFEAKMNDGTFIPSSNSIPYGYLRDSKIKALVIDDETAPVVKRMYEMRNSGMNYFQIAKMLNDEGIASPGKLRYDRNMSKDPRYKNAYWQKATVKKILNDPAYIGTRIYGTIDNDLPPVLFNRRAGGIFMSIQKISNPLSHSGLFCAFSIVISCKNAKFML